MSIIAASDFRASSVAEYCIGIELESDDADDDAIDEAITRFAQRFEEECNDRFESFDDVITIPGGGVATLVLPHRTTGVDYVVTTDLGGVDTFQPDTAYRLVSSLDADGARALRQFDHLDIIPGQVLANVPFYGSYRGPLSRNLLTGVWPDSPNSVTVSGTFGWTVTPPDVKRAVALLVWDHFRQRNSGQRRAGSWQTSDASYNSSGTVPFGIEEVDRTVANYLRDAMVPV